MNQKSQILKAFFFFTLTFVVGIESNGEIKE